MNKELLIRKHMDVYDHLRLSNFTLRNKFK